MAPQFYKAEDTKLQKTYYFEILEGCTYSFELDHIYGRITPRKIEKDAPLPGDAHPSKITATEYDDIDVEYLQQQMGGEFARFFKSTARCLWIYTWRPLLAFKGIKTPGGQACFIIGLLLCVLGIATSPKLIFQGASMFLAGATSPGITDNDTTFIYWLIILILTWIYFLYGFIF
jgi:hypothetical protein